MTTPKRRTPGSRLLLAPVAGMAVLVLATGCGDGGISLPTPSGSLSLPSLPSVSVSIPSVSVSIPSISVPSRPSAPAGTTSPSVIVPESPTPEPTRTPEPTPTPTPTPEPTRTPEPTTTPEPTRTPEPTTSQVVTATVTSSATPSAEPPTPSPSVSAAPQPVADEGGIPAWVWLVLAAALAGLAGFLLVRGRRRGEWDAEVGTARSEASWFARELLPQLQQTRTPDALAGAWYVSAARVAAVEDRLTGLEASAPDEGRGAVARDLRDAVRGARAEVESVLASRDPASAPVRLADASARLQAALNPPVSHR